MHKVYYADSFWKRTEKELSYEQIARLKKITQKLPLKPKSGVVLGPSWLRELKMHNKRVYFAVGKQAILFLDVSDKREQQLVINSLRKQEQIVLERIKPLF